MNVEPQEKNLLNINFLFLLICIETIKLKLNLVKSTGIKSIKNYILNKRNQIQPLRKD